MRIFTEEHKNKLRESWDYNKHFTKETIEKMREAHKGHIVSDEQREKLKEIRKRENNPAWKGGIIKDTNGYIRFKVPENCRFSAMKDSYRYVPMHRLMMAEYLQRPLTEKEVVHHINGIKTDNRIENLMLFENNGEHTSLHNIGNKYSLRGYNVKKV